MSDIKSGKSQIPFFEKHHHLLRRLHSLTGIVPIGVFLMSHLLTNGSIVWGHLDARKAEYGHAGVATFQHEVDFIHSIPFLFFIEISLWGSIAFHSILGVYYARTGAINTGSYNFGSNWRYRLQRLTGYIGIFFIIYHVGTLRWNWTFLTPGGTAWSAEFSGSTMAQILRGSASDVTAAGVAVSLGYLIGVSSLVFHFANGLWTSAITWGLTVSASAQRRWGYVCAGLGAGLMALGWAAVIGFATLDPGAARKTEENFRLRESREIEQIKETQSRGHDKVTQAVPAQ